MQDEHQNDVPVPEPVPAVGPSDTGTPQLEAEISPLLARELDYLAVGVPLGDPEYSIAKTATTTKVPPTGKQLVAWMRTQLGRPAGKVRENVNDYTQWYYGDNTAASWCMIFICYSFNHFGALELLNGKVAYVPSLKTHVAKGKWHSAKERGGIACGDPVTFDFNNSGDPEHVGTFIEWQDSEHTRFTSIEGNTGDDVVALRTRYWYDVHGYVKPGLSSSVPTPPAPPTTVPVPSGTPVLSTGDTGTRVKQLQSALNAWVTAGSKLKVDGDFGPATSAAVRAFQRAHKLTADGEYGPKTAAALKKVFAA